MCNSSRRVMLVGRGSECRGRDESCKSYVGSRPLQRQPSVGMQTSGSPGRAAFVLLNSHCAMGAPQPLINHSAYLRVRGTCCRWRVPHGHIRLTTDGLRSGYTIGAETMESHSPDRP